MKRLQLISQGSLNRMLHDADTAWERGDYQQSCELLERASRLNPSNFKILLQLGQFYGWRWDYAAAERCFEKAASVAAKKTEALATAGRLAVDFANPQMAEHFFQRALEQKDATPETLARLAEFYERMRRIEDASRMVERALQLDGNCARADLPKRDWTAMQDAWNKRNRFFARFCLRPSLNCGFVVTMNSVRCSIVKGATMKR